MTFYDRFFTALEREFGVPDPETIAALVGFDAGGPLNFCTFGRTRSDRYVTYVSCELAVREEQVPSSCGRYELVATSDDEGWVRDVLSEIGRMSLEVAFDDGHTMDIGPWVGPDAALQGVIFETAAEVVVDGETYAALRVIGVTRDELEFAMERGTEALNKRLRRAGVYPATIATRRSAV